MSRGNSFSNRLFDELSDVDWLEPATVRDHVTHAFFWAPFEVQPDVLGMDGKEVWVKLKEQGVETRPRDNRALYDQPGFKNHEGFNGEFPWTENPNEHDYDLKLPNVEEVVGNMIGLPNHPKLTEDDIKYVINVVRKLEPEND